MSFNAYITYNQLVKANVWEKIYNRPFKKMKAW